MTTPGPCNPIPCKRSSPRPADQFEPNQDFGHAVTIGVDRSIQATDRGRRRRLVLFVDRHGELVVQVSSVPAEMDVVFRLWNNNKDVLTNWFAPLAKGGNTQAVIDLPGWVATSSRCATNDDAWLITPFTLSTGFTLSAEVGEPNNTFEFAVPGPLTRPSPGPYCPPATGTGICWSWRR